MNSNNNNNNNKTSSYDYFCNTLIALSTVDEFYRQQLYELMTTNFKDLELLQTALSNDYDKFKNGLDVVKFLECSKHKVLGKEKIDGRILRGSD